MCNRIGGKAILIFLLQTSTGERSDEPLPRSSSPAPTSPNLSEPNVATMSRLQAIVMTQGLEPDFMRSVYASFLFRQTQPLIVEAFDSGIMSSQEMRRLIVAAEVRNLRVSTLIQIIMKALQD
jgi:hypothetical protein